MMKWLQGSEAADKLNPLIEARGWTLLNGSDNPVLTRALVAVDAKDEVQGYFVMQMFPMLGPVATIHGANPETFRDLVAEMRKFLAESGARGWMIVAEDPRIADFCEGLGFVKETNPVYWGK